LQDSVIYANSIIKIREKRLLNGDREKRMIDAPSVSDAVKVLYECGYSENLITENGGDDGALIADELQKTVGLFSELCCDVTLYGIVMKRFDFHNAKVAFKGRVTGKTDAGALYPFGFLPPQKITAAVKTGRFGDFYDALKDAAAKLFKRSETALLSAQAIDIELDAAYFGLLAELVPKLKNGVVRDYYRAHADITNLNTVLRCRRLGFDAAHTRERLVAGGTISAQDLVDALGAEPTAYAARFLNTPVFGLVKKFCAALSDAEERPAFAAAASRFSADILEKGKDDIFSVAPLFRYFEQKLGDLKRVRYILTAKRCKIDPKVIYAGI
jgi:V/A-type H+-transporting ATPase subunit C